MTVVGWLFAAIFSVLIVLPLRSGHIVDQFLNLYSRAKEPLSFWFFVGGRALVLAVSVWLGLGGLGR